MVQSRDDNKDADTALDQIKRRNYPQIQDDYKGKIILVGINYYSDIKNDDSGNGDSDSNVSDSTLSGDGTSSAIGSEGAKDGQSIDAGVDGANADNTSNADNKQKGSEYYTVTLDANGGTIQEVGLSRRLFTIAGGQLVGERYSHSGYYGESGHGTVVNLKAGR